MPPASTWILGVPYGRIDLLLVESDPALEASKNAKVGLLATPSINLDLHIAARLSGSGYGDSGTKQGKILQFQW
jgi:hypothetical protein